MTALTTCEQCGAVISGAFARVFGNNDHKAYACPHCASAGAITSGAAVSEAATGGRSVWIHDGEEWTLEHREPRGRDDGSDEQTPVYLDDIESRSEQESIATESVAAGTNKQCDHSDSAFVALLD